VAIWYDDNVHCRNGVKNEIYGDGPAMGTITVTIDCTSVRSEYRYKKVDVGHMD